MEQTTPENETAPQENKKHVNLKFKKPKPFTTAVGIAVLLIAVGGIFAFTRNKADAPSVQNNNSTQPSASSSAQNVEQGSATYTLAEVGAHGTEQDCWMAIEGKVYNVTKFIPSHPGGKAILNGCGKDATVLFNERPTNDRGPHPAQARSLLQNYEIGILVQ